MRTSNKIFLIALAIGVPVYFVDTKPIPELWKGIWIGVQLMLLATAVAVWAFEARD